MFPRLEQLQLQNYMRCTQESCNYNHIFICRYFHTYDEIMDQIESYNYRNFRSRLCILNGYRKKWERYLNDDDYLQLHEKILNYKNIVNSDIMIYSAEKYYQHKNYIPRMRFCLEYFLNEIFGKKYLIRDLAGIITEYCTDLNDRKVDFCPIYCQEICPKYCCVCDKSIMSSIMYQLMDSIQFCVICNRTNIIQNYEPVFIFPNKMCTAYIPVCKNCLIDYGYTLHNLKKCQNNCEECKCIECNGAKEYSLVYLGDYYNFAQPFNNNPYHEKHSVGLCNGFQCDLCFMDLYISLIGIIQLYSQEMKEYIINTVQHMSREEIFKHLAPTSKSQCAVCKLSFADNERYLKIDKFNVHCYNSSKYCALMFSKEKCCETHECKPFNFMTAIL